MTGSDGQLALIKLSHSASSITTLELRLSDHIGHKFCSLGDFPELRILKLSISYDSFRPLHVLALFLSKSQPAKKLAEISIHLRLDAENFERSSQELTRICSNKDWQLVQQTLIMEAAFPSLSKLNIVFRPKDVATFISDYLNLSLNLCLLKSMPTLYAQTHPKIDIYDAEEHSILSLLSNAVFST
ncbi:hypothetical protein JR316_0005667 [Psilocybe cubensis]|uniref:Uncharacterized protein n=1 Tax=Psilocybe cubensis TaxID=181762 RepID=A0ACB8H0D5_PSICU|nr:hypothetical protein JR316_0005667 [Psilocybe cubensis]KAH9481147.1 hypothetical protein JR316_0005667 [Psilocybe cubensis]